jgi:hypothetical protein
MKETLLKIATSATVSLRGKALLLIILILEKENDFLRINEMSKYSKNSLEVTAAAVCELCELGLMTETRKIINGKTTVAYKINIESL